MVPVYVKGGSWSNIEDEILKAAVTKYGLNQWHRVASLLARKTAKQAKARWNEYLDPRIRKSDWSQQEDVKLLELARLLPNQWRSIASTLGRTATQCLDRYQKLLDDEGSSELGLSGPGVETLESVGASKDLQIGDINVNAETKEARPDAVDLDDDEREMLSEARARLANTRGKKATRKARERMLEESKRVSLLQKRRDLKQAGITTKLRSGKKKFSTQIDYNADIPFEHTPTTGFYDTTEEVVANDRNLQKFERQVDRTGVNDDTKKGSKRPRDQKKDPIVTIEREAIQSDDPTKRRKLDLAEPVFGDGELLALHKLGSESVETAISQRVTDQQVIVDDKLHEMARKIKESGAEKSALITVDEPEVLEEDGESFNEPTVVPDTEDLKTSIRKKLLSLPKPKNDFEIIIDDEKPIKVSQREPIPSILEDSGEKERLRRISEEKEKQKALLRRSQVLRRSLPIPLVDGSLKLPPQDKSSLSKVVDSELITLIRSDYAKANKVGGIPLIDDLDETSLENVKNEILKEVDSDSLSKFQMQFMREHILASSNSDEGLDKDTLITTLTTLIEKTNKLESKVSLSLGGYVKRNDALTEEMLDLLRDLKDADRALAAFTMLYESESVIVKFRADILREQVDILVNAEHTGQQTYLDLKRSFMTDTH